ncbi:MULTISPECIES: biopolymer transporter ExbD [unclassified Yoonia]|uniref:biopolymer transporter ExbD n=1 Tax=unclassified Yoonia TaxID=2629118 RepID=UPI002B000AD8|nr:MULTISPECIES: biopolymer transporter ExbD [unclassified Yoonia]
MPRPARRRRRLSMTSLIDVIFLLLLFFMLSSTFSRYGDLPFITATGGATPLDGPAPAFLRVQPDGLRLNVADVTLADLPTALAALEVSLVLIVATDGVSAQDLVDVLVIVQAVPDLTLRLIGG